ncbi:MAG: hypothetical protein IH872_00050 [Chloroflexi bacterium]|nr:hypothetical protein [Chloroflexota bacterium]
MKMANPRALMALVMITAVGLTACGGTSGGAATDAGPQTVARSADAIPVVSLSMDDYLGSTVVLYFSFPG